nr:MAG: replication initiator protein [Microvirus sp.]
MTCFHPLSAYRTAGGDIIFNGNKRGLNITEALQLPCGQCVGCRLERSRQWAMRCMHESQLHKENTFITLTYAPEHLPPGGTLVLKHFQKFMKRLRKKFGPNIRFYHCGEYGETTGRPHYHAILFGIDFSDKKHFTTRNGFPVYRSETLKVLWPYGNHEIGSVTFESAAYVARYIMKKINGKNADQHYQTIDPTTGEIHQRKPEYTTMSRRPGIASGWFERYTSDVYPHDRVVIRGRQMRPPKFYDNKFELLDPAGYEEIKYNRHKNSQIHLDNQTKSRLNVRETVQILALKQLPRNLD